MQLTFTIFMDLKCQAINHECELNCGLQSMDLILLLNTLMVTKAIIY